MRTLIKIDFAKPAWYKPYYVTGVGACLMLLSLIFFCSVFGYQKISHSKQLEIQQSALAAHRKIAKEEKNNMLQPILNSEQQQILTEMIHQLNLPWNHLFNALEQMQNNDVVLISVVPNHSRQQIELSGEARNLSVIFAYIESLEALPMLEHVTLLKHQVIESNPYQPVEFSILAGWKL
jgi:hypothetical protein